ncbi:MAG: low specificity L-threonine aldolase, partial [Phycisphaerales bacterium]
ADVPGIAVEPAPRGVRTNMVFLRVPGDAHTFCASLASHGVRMIPMGAGRVRAVTHLDVDEGGIERAIEAVRSVASAG